MNHLTSYLRGCLLLLCLSALLAAPAAAADPFPHYPFLQANVDFWKKVYSQYPSAKGLIHDNQNLAIIYEVVSLAEGDTREAAQANERLVQGVKERYRQILLGLAQGRPPASQEERRVTELFGASATTATLLAAADNIRFQRCLSDRFQAGLIRSGLYLTQIKEIFEHHGLPSDLAYLPHVESSFDYQAYSKSGAAGIWQFIRATGSRFLTINATVDERRDPIQATHAAAKFLRGNHQKLDSWPLALTAYNHGLTSMLRAKNMHGTYENIYQHYSDSHFGFASRNFYAEFLAAREVAKNYRQYFPDLRLSAPQQTATFTVTRSASAKELASHLKVDIGRLSELNPALLAPVWEGRKPVPKGYTLRLPKDDAIAKSRNRASAETQNQRMTERPGDEFGAPANSSKDSGAVANVPALPPPPATAPPATKNATQRHQVKKGETIASIAKRYGISQRTLIDKNRLGRRAAIRAGQTLHIP